MNRDRDPRALIAIAGLIAAVLAARHLPKLPTAGEALEAAPAQVIAVIVASCIVSILAPALLRVRCTRAAMRHRETVAVVPADDFDPDPETVLRLAAQLGRLDRGIRGWLDRPGSSLRIRLEPDDDGRLTFLVEAPERARALVRDAFRGLGGVELRDGEPPVDPPADRATVRAELVLARPSVEPLSRIGLDPDPLQLAAAAVLGVEPQAGGQAVICVDLMPASGPRRSRLRRRLEREARRLRSGGRRSSIRQLLGDGEASRAEPAELAERRAEARALDNKLKDGGALFESQILIRCSAPRRPAAKAALRGVLASFEPLASDRNWLRVSGLPIPGVSFVGADLPIRRRGFDRRIATGLFRPARRCVVSGREIVGWLKPPTKRCGADNILRAGALVGVPPSLPEFSGQRNLIPIGRVFTESGARVIGVETASTFHAHISGRSRFGKTELAISQFLHLVRSGYGGLFLDPHADAIERIKPYLTADGIRERVIEINLSGSHATAAQPGWNVLGVNGPNPEERVDVVVDAIATALRWDERNSRALNLTTQATQALAAIGAVLPDELAPTIFQLPTFLSDETWRQSALPFLSRPAQRFWLERFPRLAIEAITPLTNLIDRVRASTPATALLGQSVNSYRVREAMDRGLIVLFCPGTSRLRSRFLANLALFDAYAAALSRVDILNPADRKVFAVFCDEAQTYDSGSGGLLASSIEQVGKYGLKYIISNQDIDRLSRETRAALRTNRSVLMASAQNSSSAKMLSDELGGYPGSAAFTGLSAYHFIAQVTTAAGELSRPFSVESVQAETLFGPGDDAGVARLDAEIEKTTRATPIADAIEHVDTLDDRIPEALDRIRAGDAGSAPPRRKGLHIAAGRGSA
jgi:hypothetical protein